MSVSREKLADKDVKHSDRKSVLISEEPDLLSNFRFRQSVISPKPTQSIRPKSFPKQVNYYFQIGYVMPW